MSYYYGNDTFSRTKIKPLMHILFGEKCKPLPKLYIPENLEHLVTVVNLPNSPFFGSCKDIIEKMSVFPLYNKFINNYSYKEFTKANSYKTIEHKYKLRTYAYLEGEPRIKFCKKCLQENDVIYLNREHQVQGNTICYKHKTALQYIRFNTEKRYNLNLDIQKLINKANYCISEVDEGINIHIKAADIIHEIFTYNLSDSRIVIKSKIRKRLRALGYMQYNYFTNIYIFFDDFKLYNFMLITYKQLYNMLYTTSQEEPPLAYISLIIFLFKDLNHFKNYSLNDEDLADVKYKNRAYNHLFKSSYGERMREEYNEYIRKYFGDNYEVISLIDDTLVIKHALCGNMTEINTKDYRNFRTCSMCHEIDLNNKYQQLVKQKSNNYIYLGVDPKKQSILLRHKKCNKEFRITYYNFLNGRGCNYCKKMNQYKKRIKEVYGEEYIVLDYTTYLENAKYIHNNPTCMDQIVTKPKQFIKLKYCPSCHKPKTSIANNSIIDPSKYV